MAEALTFGNAAAAGTIKTDGVDLVEIGHRIVRLRDVA